MLYSQVKIEIDIKVNTYEADKAPRKGNTARNVKINVEIKILRGRDRGQRGEEKPKKILFSYIFTEYIS